MPTLLQGASTNPNRLVAVLTPLVFAPLAGAIAAGVAKYGIDVDDGQVQAIFIAGATIALAKSAQWTKGWQAYEQRNAAAAAEPIAIGHEDDLDEVDDDDVEADDEPQVVAFDEPAVDVEDDLHDGPESELDADMDSGHDDDMDSDHDDDMHDDLDAETSELLVGQGS